MERGDCRDRPVPSLHSRLETPARAGRLDALRHSFTRNGIVASRCSWSGKRLACRRIKGAATGEFPGLLPARRTEAGLRGARGTRHGKDTGLHADRRADVARPARKTERQAG